MDLTLELDQEQRYRAGRIDILGEDPPAVKILRSMFKTGEPFNSDLLSQFYTDNESILRPDASAQDDFQLKKNNENGIVNLQFDFRTCPTVSE